MGRMFKALTFVRISPSLAERFSKDACILNENLESLKTKENSLNISTAWDSIVRSIAQEDTKHSMGKMMLDAEVLATLYFSPDYWVLLWSSEVGTLADLLSSIDVRLFHQFYKAAHADLPCGEKEIDLTRESFVALREFCKQAASTKEPLLLQVEPLK